MARFSVPIHGLGHPKHPNAACFVDYVRALAAALRDLGHVVVPPTVDGANLDRSARPICFGEQNLLTVDDPRDPGSMFPENAILYNTEQTGARGADPKRIFDAVSTWRRRVIWDYSEANATVLRKMGCERVILCPVGYHPSMTRIRPLPSEQEDIDVLFYGSVETPQRIAGLAQAGIKVLDRGSILAELRRAGLRVEHVFGVYGTDLDPYIARAKVVLNLHYYEGAVFEIFRCSQLFANKKCVVTEDGGGDEQLEQLAKDTCWYTSRNRIVQACTHLCKTPEQRAQQAWRGYEIFRGQSLVDHVQRALGQS